MILGVCSFWLLSRGALKRPGLITGVFLVGYGLSRFVVEFFRQADAQFITPDNPLGHVLWIAGLRPVDGTDTVAADDRCGGLVHRAVTRARPVTPLARSSPRGSRRRADHAGRLHGRMPLHPRYGYYTTRDPFGAAGDFTTAPEISQMFGELMGLFWRTPGWIRARRPVHPGRDRSGPRHADGRMRCAPSRRCPACTRRAGAPGRGLSAPCAPSRPETLGRPPGLTGTTGSRISPTGRSSLSPTNSSMPCRSASSSVRPDGWRERHGRSRRRATLSASAPQTPWSSAAGRFDFRAHPTGRHCRALPRPTRSAEEIARRVCAGWRTAGSRVRRLWRLAFARRHISGAARPPAR